MAMLYIGQVQVVWSLEWQEQWCPSDVIESSLKWVWIEIYIRGMRKE